MKVTSFIKQKSHRNKISNISNNIVCEEESFMKISGKSSCPCGSKKRYKNCCEIFHRGKLPKDALLLMRSRYCAYAIGLTNYIISTTISTSKEFQNPNWENEIRLFSESTKFLGVTILNKSLGDIESYVTFRANLIANKQDISFTEKSRFLKIDKKWFYESGDIL